MMIQKFAIVLFLALPLVATATGGGPGEAQIQRLTTLPGVPKYELFQQSPMKEPPRGGGGRGGAVVLTSLQMQRRANVVRAHGYTSALFVVLYALESCGIDTFPVFGLTHVYSGVGLNEVTKMFLRTLCVFMAFASVIEVQLADNAHVQQTFLLYHVPLVLATVKGSVDAGVGWMSWVSPAIVAGFGLAGALA